MSQTKRQLNKFDKETIDWLMKLMLANKMFHVKIGEIEIQASQYAFVPSPVIQPPAPIAKPPQPADYPELSAPFQAFKPWKRPEPEPEVYSDPSDPDGMLDDNQLFGSGLPNGN